MRTLTLCLLLLPVLATSISAQSGSPAAQDCAEANARLTQMESRLQDWSELARYRDANAQLPSGSANENRVVFMGDSITDLWDDAGYGGFFPGKPYVNRGISGQTTPQMLIRFRPDVIELRPKVVVILAGTNDLAGNTGPTSLETIEGNLSSMAELARAHNVKVVLASLLPVSDYEKNREGNTIVQTVRRSPEKIKALNQWIKDYAARNNFTYLDYYSATVDERGFLKDELSDDGLHANAKGYAVMSPLAERAIVSAMKMRAK
jgi:lysophospholipase L1-like esterase